MTLGSVVSAVGVTVHVVCGICCFWLSGEKNRSGLWFFVGLAFGLLGLITLVGAPVMEKNPRPTSASTTGEFHRP